MQVNNVYLDYNATTPIKPSILEDMQEVMRLPLNPSSVHKTGMQARKYVEDARSMIAECLEVEDAKIIFTSSGTEANNLALRGTECKQCVVSAIEHPSIVKQAKGAAIIPVDAHGQVDLIALEQVLSSYEERVLVSVMLANNETGVIQPMHAIVELVRHYGHYIHTDACQAVGKIPVSFQSLDVDMMTVSSHKCGGPVGAAALIVKKNLALTPQIVGGGQEQNMRAGTENVAAIYGFGRAVRYAVEADEVRMHDVAALRNKLEASIVAIAPEAVIFGKEVDRLPNTSCITMPETSNETQLIYFDLQGISVSAGSACSSGKVDTSHVLKAMGVPEALASCAIRISLGVATKQEEIEYLLKPWKELYEHIQEDNKIAV